MSFGDKLNPSVPVIGTYAATTTLILEAKVSGDTVDRFNLGADGKMQWGPGNGAADCILSRTGAATIQANWNQQTVGYVIAQNGNAGQITLGAVGPASQAAIGFGSAQDANIYRTAAAQLTTDSGLNSISPTAGIGYATGAGGTVTQLTSRTTGVTLNKICGQITTNNASLAAGAEAGFTVTNSAVAATDVIVVSIKPGGTGTPQAYVSNVAAGSFQITLTNLDAATADTSADVLNFAVLKAVAA